MIDVAIITVPRKITYIHSTIESLFSSGCGELKSKIRLHVGSAGAGYLSRYKSDIRFRLQRLDPGDLLRLGRLKLWQCQGLNYLRCLQAAPTSRATIVLEDDIVFSKGWYQWTLSAINQIEKIYDRWMLTLCCFSGEAVKRYEEGARWFPDGAPWWCGGACGIVYPSNLIEELASYIEEHLVVGDELPTDLLIHRWAKEKEVQFCATAPSLIQHVGEVSTGLGGGGRRSPSFVESVL